MYAVRSILEPDPIPHGLDRYEWIALVRTLFDRQCATDHDIVAMLEEEG